MSAPVSVPIDKSTSPKTQGWAFPAEWTPHRACLLLYPHNVTTYNIPKARREFCCFAKAIALDGEEDVVMFLNSDTEIYVDVEQSFWTLIESTCASPDQIKALRERVVCKPCTSDDTWCRDTGPSFLTRPRAGDETKNDLLALDWDFNAYGGEHGGGVYWPCDKDLKVCTLMVEEVQKLDAQHKIEVRKVPLILEGGSFHVDGEGTCLVTEETLLNTNRNPHMTKAQIEEYLVEFLNVEKVIWLGDGLFGDEDTNGHIDNFACFVQPGHVILAWCDDVSDAQHSISVAAYNLLMETTDAKGRKLKVTKLHCPKNMFLSSEEAGALSIPDHDKYYTCREESALLAGSYVNFYIANKAIVLPGFGDEEMDRRAVETMEEACPDRKVVQVFSKEILIGGGNLHCVSQQMPEWP